MERKDWPLKIYRNFETPDEDDRKFYASLTGEERIQMMIDMLPPEHYTMKIDRTPIITRRKIEPEPKPEEPS